MGKNQKSVVVVQIVPKFGGWYQQYEVYSHEFQQEIQTMASGNRCCKWVDPSSKICQQ